MDWRRWRTRKVASTGVLAQQSSSLSACPLADCLSDCHASCEIAPGCCMGHIPGMSATSLTTDTERLSLPPPPPPATAATPTTELSPSATGPRDCCGTDHANDCIRWWCAWQFQWRWAYSLTVFAWQTVIAINRVQPPWTGHWPSLSTSVTALNWSAAFTFSLVALNQYNTVQYCLPSTK